MHPATLPPERLRADCLLRRVRASGPGGQRRNKVHTGVELVHEPTGLAVRHVKFRSSEENEAAALSLLRLRLAVEVRGEPPPVLDAAPTDLWKSRTRGGKIVCRTGHEDYPALLAEALDRLHVAGGDFPAAAEPLGVSVSQLQKFLRAEPSAWLKANGWREEMGLPRIR